MSAAVEPFLVGAFASVPAERVGLVVTCGLSSATTIQPSLVILCTCVGQIARAPGVVLVVRLVPAEIAHYVILRMSGPLVLGDILVNLNPIAYATGLAQRGCPVG